LQVPLPISAWPCSARGGWTAFCAHLALVALAVVLFVLAGVSLVAGGNLSRGLREDRGNRWVIGALVLLGLLAPI
jgi:hypothetical protein